MQTKGFRDLVRKAQAGDPAAVQQLFEQVLPFVEGLVRARGVCPGDSVSDHAQNACVRILTRLNQFRGAQDVEDDDQVAAPFRSWMRLIARSGTDSTSVMYATLNTGTVNRSLTAADLNVADSDTTGACGLHAATSGLRPVC